MARRRAQKRRRLGLVLAAAGLAGCDAVGSLLAPQGGEGLSAFERGIDERAEIRVDGLVAANRRYGYGFRRTGGLSLSGARIEDVKYGINIVGGGAPEGSEEASLLRDLSVTGWKRYDQYGAAVSIGGAAAVYIAGLRADMGQSPSGNYRQWNIDGVALERGGEAPLTMLRDVELRNVTDALIDAKHRVVVGHMTGGNAQHLLKIWGKGGEIVIAHCDLSLGYGENFVQLIGDARLAAHDCRWRLPDGTVFTRLDQIPDAYVSLSRGATRAQMVDLEADPLAGLPFFTD